MRDRANRPATSPAPALGRRGLSVRRGQSPSAKCKVLSAKCKSPSASGLMPSAQCLVPNAVHSSLITHHSALSSHSALTSPGFFPLLCAAALPSTPPRRPWGFLYRSKPSQQSQSQQRGILRFLRCLLFKNFCSRWASWCLGALVSWCFNEPPFSARRSDGKSRNLPQPHWLATGGIVDAVQFRTVRRHGGLGRRPPRSFFNLRPESPMNNAFAEALVIERLTDTLLDPRSKFHRDVFDDDSRSSASIRGSGRTPRTLRLVVPESAPDAPVVSSAARDR